MAITEYQPGTTFPGVIARTADESTPAWPAPKRPAEDAPNVVFIVLDDTGYGHLGCYGSPIATPNIDALAADGLKYSNMNTTALCSPSRSCILNGRNHHSNHLACLTNGSTGYPGSDGYIPFENGFLSEILRAQGYNTYCVGKWHLAPEETMTAAGPYDRWPLGRGFERYYGFLGGDTHQYYPELVRDNSQTEPETTPGAGLPPDPRPGGEGHGDDRRRQAGRPNKPFFLYFAPGAMHSPHHVPKEWADRYAGKFDRGWEVYRARCSSGRSSSGWFPRRRTLRARSRRRGLGDAVGRRTPALRADDGGVRRLPRAHRPLHRRTRAVPERHWRVRQHGDHARSPTTGPARRAGPPARSTRSASSTTSPTPSKKDWPHRRDRRPDGVQPLPLGLDACGQHPVPALEAGDLPGRVDRSVHRHLAARHRRARRAALALRTHHRHGADGARRAPRRGAAGHRRCHPVADRRGQLRAHLRRRRGADPASDPVLRDARAPLDLPRRLAGRMPLAGNVVRRVGRTSSAIPSPPTCSASSTRRDGSSTTSPRTSPRPPTWPSRNAHG